MALNKALNIRTKEAPLPCTPLGQNSAPGVCGWVTRSVLEPLSCVYLLTIPRLARSLRPLIPPPKLASPVLCSFSQSDCDGERTPLSDIQKIPFCCPRILRLRPHFHKDNGTWVEAAILPAVAEVTAAKTGLFLRL